MIFARVLQMEHTLMFFVSGFRGKAPPALLWARGDFIGDVQTARLYIKNHAPIRRYPLCGGSGAAPATPRLDWQILIEIFKVFIETRFLF